MKPGGFWLAIPVTVSAFAAGCHDPLSYSIATGPRDWSAHPAVASLSPAGDVYAASDIHGGYDRFAALLVMYGLAPGVPSSPELAQWSGGNATLVIAGDLFDKGPAGLEVIDLFERSRQVQ
jgi:hypothetical protein